MAQSQQQSTREQQRQDQDSSQGQGQLNFITFGEPPQSKSTRAIRSHAAKAGWKSRKNSRSVFAASSPLVRPTTEPAPRALYASRQRNLPIVPSWAPDIVVAHKPTPSLSSSSSTSSLSTTNSSCSTPSTTQSSPDVTTAISTGDSEFTRIQPVDDGKEDAPYTRWNASTALIPTQPQSVNQPFQPRPIGSIHDPFSQFPIPWEDSYGTLVHFYRNCIGEAWLKLIAADWGRQGNVEFVDFPLHISIAQREPAMFYAVMSNTSLMAPSSNAISMRQQPFLSQWLRHKAVEALRGAIADPKRAYTDAVICTVVFIYVNEALRGEDETATRVHGPALQKMVAVRGGLNVIASNGMQGLILSRMLTWADRIAASTLGIPLLFPDYVEDLSLGQTKWTGIWSKVQTMM